MNHLKHAFRFIIRDKFHTVLNVLGLTLGLICSIIVYMYAHTEINYDNHYTNADRIYRVSSDYVTSGKDIRFASASPSLGYKLANEYPEIEAFVRINQIGTHKIEIGDQYFYESKFVFADTNTFELFDYKFIYGDPKTCLNEPSNIVLTEKTAKKYFGDEYAIGKIVRGNNTSLKVSAVIEDQPDNCHLKADAYISYLLLDKDAQLTSIEWSLYEPRNEQTFILTTPRFTFEQFYEKWPAFYQKHCSEDEKNYNQVFKPIFQKLTEVHYHPMDLRFDDPKGNSTNLYVIISMGILIIILSCINYVNMSTARYGRRTKEIGVKKAVGASRWILIRQFMLESYILTFISIDLALVIVELILSRSNFNTILNVNLNLAAFTNPNQFVVLIIIFICIGGLSGFYPAFYLSSVSTIKSLTGKIKKGRSGKIVRNILVSLQFIISITVIIVTLFMNYQVNFLKNKDLGFDKENIMVVELNDTLITNNYNLLEAELMRNPNISSVSVSYSRPGQFGSGLYTYENSNHEFEEHNLTIAYVSHTFMETLNIKLAYGRAFDVKNSNEFTTAVLVNESMVRFMKWDDPIRMRVRTNRNFEARVVGVVKDFSFSSLHEKIAPLVLRGHYSVVGSLLIKINGNIQNTVKQVKEQLEILSPGNTLTHSFLEQELNEYYIADEQQSKLIQLISILCVIVSLIGLFGLTSFTAISRTKEVGIRKAIGSSTLQIVLLLFKEVFILVVIAFIVAIPISYYFINIWLENFAFRADINIWIFAIVFVLSVFIASITALYHTIRVAISNPVNALRYE